MAKVNSIGTAPDPVYLFEDMQGSLSVAAEGVEVYARPGVAGVGARGTSSRNPQIQIRTIHYVEDYAAAKNAMLAYRALIGQKSQKFVQYDIDWGEFLVVNVVQEAATEGTSSIGTLIANATVRQVCVWSIVGVGT